MHWDLERAKGIEPYKAAFQSAPMRPMACTLTALLSEIVPFRFVDFDTFSTSDVFRSAGASGHSAGRDGRGEAFCYYFVMQLTIRMHGC